jgi:alkanesulfonate monooxygenase SsuD/methylene tetrahydromethanopterin reductase-like flavin-dependent oxidoreductase (luciferase family)
VSKENLKELPEEVLEENAEEGRMKIGMNLPVMVPGLNRDLILDWCRRIDNGPYNSLASGERINFSNPEVMVTMAAAAAVTERVRLTFSILVLPMHNEVLIAKQIATLDVLSEGRVTLGLGVGGRKEDYDAVGADFNIKRVAHMEGQVARMRRVWAGENVVEGALRCVEPAPIQEGGPELLAGVIMPKTIERAAQWADGITDFSFGPSLPEIEGKITMARDAWEKAGRDTPPRFVASFWYALGDQARSQLDDYLGSYLNFLGPELSKALIPTVTTTSAQQLKELAQALEKMGVDELILAPTTSDPDDVDRVADLLG